MLSCVSLQHASDKSVREEETGEPETVRMSFLGPLSHKLHSFSQVENPGRKRFEGGVRDFLPILGHLIFEQTRIHFVQNDAHYFSSVHCSRKLNQRSVNSINKAIVAGYLLKKHCCEAVK